MEKPWLKSYPKNIDWNFSEPADTLNNLFTNSVNRFGSNNALDFFGKKTSYSELGIEVISFAEGLRKLGVGPGSKVGLCLPNTPYYIIAYFAVLKVGGTVVNINPLYVETELESQIKDSDTSIMITVDINPIFERIKNIFDKRLIENIIVCRFHLALPFIKSIAFYLTKNKMIASIPENKNIITYKTITKDLPSIDFPKVKPNDIAVLQYTGGTTGISKGAILTHSNLVANAQQVQQWVPDVVFGEERILAILPFFHVFAMTTILNAGIAWGAEIIMLPRFEVSQVFSTLRRTRPTIFPGVPTLFKTLLDKGATNEDLKSVRFCISGGAPLPLSVKTDFEKASGCILVEGYGLTEASPVCFANPTNGENKAGTIGLPLPGVDAEIRSLENPNITLNVGDKGELVIKGPNVMLGYYNQPKETANQFTVDGWLRTGDVGIMDSDGYVTLVDRIKDIVITSGFNIYPRNVEDALYRHPEVVAATVLGIPDPYRGESVAAFVQLKEGSTLSKEKILEFLRIYLSPLEIPKILEIRESLPRTTIGKLSKKELREEFLKSKE